jgi:sulfite exporter TauE/SafE/plastocyanin domain-containing protein/copper chaperone CopZ
MANKKIILRISGMTCGHCEKRIVSAVKKLNGVVSATASFPKKQAEVTYDESKTGEKEIRAAIEAEGYAVRPAGREKQSMAKVLPVFLIILAVYFILKYSIGFDFFNLIPRIDSTVSLAALFAMGIFTSVHCIAMCGGLNLSQSVGAGQSDAGRFKKPLLYNLGRIVSYTAVGAVVGGLGSVLFISITAKGVIMLAAAIFMILMGLSMLGWLPHWLVPRLPKKAVINTNKAGAGKGPFVVGLLNGLLPCGPLQAMQIYALSTGSAAMGALSMLLFSLGTVPLMLGAGFVFTLLKGKFTRGITRVSAVLVILIAVVMFTNAGGLFGWNISGTASAASQATQADITEEPQGGSSDGAVSTVNGYQIAQMGDGVQTVEATLGASGYPRIIVQKGVPVKYNLKADDKNINGCNGTVVIPKFNIQKTLQAGDNIMEFTPGESGAIPYTCWMGMISGQIQVVDDLASVASGSAPAPSVQPDDSQAALSGGCCAGTGQAAAFANGNIPVDEVQVAQVKDGEQIMTVTVDDRGYTPAVLVVQKGVKTVIKFNPESLSSCNAIVTFPEYNGSLYLSRGQTETPELTPESDFTFECGMGMLHGYVKVVDDINSIDLDAIKSEVSQYKPASGGGCCG